MRNLLPALKTHGRRRVSPILAALVIACIGALAYHTVVNHWRNYPSERRQHFNTRFKTETTPVTKQRERGQLTAFDIERDLR